MALKSCIRNRGKKRFSRNAKNNHVACFLPELESVLPSGSTQKSCVWAQNKEKSFKKPGTFRKQLWILFIHLLVCEPVVGTWIIILTSLPLHFTRAKKCPPTSTGMWRLKGFVVVVSFS